MWWGGVRAEELACMGACFLPPLASSWCPLTTWFWAQMDTTPLEIEAIIGRTGCHWGESGRKHLDMFQKYNQRWNVDQWFNLWYYSDIQQQLPSGPVQDLHQVSNALLPNVEGVLPGRPCHDVFAITGEAAALPGSPDTREIHRDHTRHVKTGPSRQWETRAAVDSVGVWPVDQVLQLLHGLRLAVAPTGQYLPAIVHPDDAVRCVYQEAAVQDKTPAGLNHK